MVEMAFLVRRGKRQLPKELKLLLPTQMMEFHPQQLLHMPSPDSHPLPPSSPDSSLGTPSSPDSFPGIEIETLYDLEKLEVIGHGNGGTVYKVRHRWTSAIFALKVLRLGLDSAAIRHQAARESDILRLVDSPFVVRCHTVFTDDNGFNDTDGYGGDICFVMEYMDGGSLHDVLQMQSRLSENHISYIARQVLEGLKYLHGMNIVHRDIKPSNLLINGHGEVKIADFGVSRVVAGNAYCSSYVGTCAYMSPERFDPDRCDGQYNGFAADVWALGLALLECHVGHFPLISVGQRPDWATLMCAICFGDPPQMPEAASPEFQSFVRGCLEKDWWKRPTVQELLNHPFLDKCSNRGLVVGDFYE